MKRITLASFGACLTPYPIGAYLSIRLMGLPFQKTDADSSGHFFEDHITQNCQLNLNAYRSVPVVPNLVKIELRRSRLPADATGGLERIL